jgi:hypothetical protein
MSLIKLVLPVLAVAVCCVAIAIAASTTPPTTTDEPSTSTAAPVDTDTTASAGDVYVKVRGQSGKIVIGKSENPDSDPKSVVVNFDSIQEKDVGDNIVGKSGSAADKHSFNTFANQDFTVGAIEDATYQDIAAKMFNFTSTINGAELAVDVYIFTEGGNITLDGEVTPVKEGNVKFNIMIQNWDFCGSAGVDCKKGQGPSQTDEVRGFCL